MRLGNWGQVRSGNLLSGIAMTSGVDAWHPPICSVSSLYSVVLQYMIVHAHIVRYGFVDSNPYPKWWPSAFNGRSPRTRSTKISFSVPQPVPLIGHLRSISWTPWRQMLSASVQPWKHLAVPVGGRWPSSCFSPETLHANKYGRTKGNSKNPLLLCSCAVIRSTVQVRKDI